MINKTLSQHPGYGVTSDGQIINLKTNKILNPSTDKDGYKYVTLRLDGKSLMVRVHRAVATEWIRPPIGEEVVDHLDSDPGNNDVSNLQWVSARENTRRARKRKPWRSKPPPDPEKIRLAKSLYPELSQEEIATKLGVSGSTISRWLNDH